MSKKSKNNVQKTLIPMPTVQSSGQMPSLDIPNLNHYIRLMKELYERTKKQLDAGDFNKGTLTSKRIKVNKLNRELNNHRKKIVAPYRKPIKHIKSQIDILRKYAKATTQLCNTKLNIYKQQTKQKLRSHWQAVTDQMCDNRKIAHFQVPDICLKPSLSNKKRLEIISHETDIEVADKHRRFTKPIGNKMVDTISNKVVGNAVQNKLQFHDSESNYMALIHFAIKNNINIRFPKEKYYIKKYKKQQAIKL